MLDPQFWLALGKSLGWADKKFYQYEASHSFLGEEMPEWKWYTRLFFSQYILEGKTAEDFFEDLTSGEKDERKFN